MLGEWRATVLCSWAEVNGACAHIFFYLFILCALPVLCRAACSASCAGLARALVYEATATGTGPRRGDGEELTMTRVAVCVASSSSYPVDC
ncbi:hypothetical protein T492DRAFT_937958, partial [Pavlovales sp. CCMP2436]